MVLRHRTSKMVAEGHHSDVLQMPHTLITLRTNRLNRWWLGFSRSEARCDSYKALLRAFRKSLKIGCFAQLSKSKLPFERIIRSSEKVRNHVLADFFETLLAFLIMSTQSRFTGQPPPGRQRETNNHINC